VSAGEFQFRSKTATLAGGRSSSSHLCGRSGPSCAGIPWDGPFKLAGCSFKEKPRATEVRAGLSDGEPFGNPSPST